MKIKSTDDGSAKPYSLEHRAAISFCVVLTLAAAGAILSPWRSQGTGLAPIPQTPNTPPTVTITSPAGGASFAVPADITITASASDSDGTISKVEFYQGATKLFTR